MIVELPGFQDLVRDSQVTFRTLLNALSRPGIAEKIDVKLIPPSELNVSCAAACLTLFDLETEVWLQPGLGEDIKSWLLFHTGCSFTKDTQQADFAVICNLENMPDLCQFKQGTPVYPEDSTTLLITVDAIDDIRASNHLSLQRQTLTGAGINQQITMPISLSDTFSQQWQQNHNSYPQGIDIYFFFETQVVGLPRTSNIA